MYAALCDDLQEQVEAVETTTGIGAEGRRGCLGIDDDNQVALRDYLTSYSRGWKSEVTTAVKDLTGTFACGIAYFQ